MLSVPQLDDLGYEKLVERAQSRIPAMTEEWTDFNAHDPGITTLQTFAWLSDTLNYYMDATGEAHRLKYFKLLGIQPHQQAAECTVEVHTNQKEYVVPRGTRLEAAGIPFETAQTYAGSGNSVCAVYRMVEDNLLDITHLAGVDGGYAEIFSYDFRQRPSLYLGFENKLQGQTEFYVQVEENPLRNAFRDEFSLVSLCWEFYDGRSWQSAEVAEDKTCGFLRSGFIKLKLNGTTGKMENPLFTSAYYLRCTLCENNYDILPRIGKIAPNCIQAIQAQTAAQALEYVYSGEREIVIDYFIQENDYITVAVETEMGFVTWYEHGKRDDNLCCVIKGEQPWQRKIVFEKEKPQNGKKILILITSSQVYTQLVLGITDGCAEQKIDFAPEGLLELKLALVTRIEGRSCYEIWNQCEDVKQAGWNEKVFAFDDANGKIVFGDGIHGRQPEPDATVMAITVKVSEFEQGNVRKGLLDTIKEEELAEIQVESLEDAHGGLRKAAAQQLEQQLEEKMTKVSRAVTAQDYKNIVKHTPGLMIDYVNVITAKEYAQCYGGKAAANTVLLAVKPHTHDARSDLDERTKEIILKNIQKYRLLTTDVEIVNPEYVGVNIFGRIDLKEDTKEARREVMQMLSEKIDFNKTGGFEQNVAYGKVFSALEMMDCVKRVNQLSFELVGKGAQKNERGDICVYPNGLTYVKAVDIEFV